MGSYWPETLGNNIKHLNRFYHKLGNMPSIGPDSVMENGMNEDHYNSWPNDKGVSEAVDTSNYIY